MTRIERWFWIHATCRQGWRRLPIPWFLLLWLGARRTGPCGRHKVEHFDDYGCGLCCHEAITKRNGQRIRAMLAKRRGLA